MIYTNHGYSYKRSLDMIRKRYRNKHNIPSLYKNLKFKSVLLSMYIIIGNTREVIKQVGEKVARFLYNSKEGEVSSELQKGFFEKKVKTAKIFV